MGLPLLASRVGDQGSLTDSLLAVGMALLGIAAVVLIGRYGLNPFFRILARSGAREVMTASALLVVLGAALLGLDRLSPGGSAPPEAEARVRTALEAWSAHAHADT